MKRKKRNSDTVLNTSPPTKSRLLEKSSTSTKNTSLSTLVSYDFDEPVTHQSIVPRVSELEVSVDNVHCLCQEGYIFVDVGYFCLFVGRITQKLLDQFSHNSVEMCHMGRRRNHWILVDHIML